MKDIRYIKRIAAVLTLLALYSFGHAQHLSGPDPVELGINYTYTFNDGNSRPGGVWEVTGGTVMSTSSSGMDYFAIVQWNVLGVGDVAFKDRNDVVLDNMAVTVNPPTPVVVTALNYVHNITPRTATTDITTLTNGEKIEAISYFDGLGRAKQSVAIRAGGNSEDIITPMEYDPYGRMVREYLPYSATTNIGSYRSDALTKVLDYYDTTAYDDDFPGMTTVDINPYSEKEFDDSPLNRVMKQAAPGKDWKLGNGHEIEMDYLTNTSATEVRRYDVSLSKNTVSGVVTYVPTLSTGGHYAVHELIKTVTRDENHPGTATKDHTTEEFKDKQGQVVLKRTYDNGVAHDTYYAYDDFGNLSFVMPPKVEAHVDKPDGTELSELCYQYRYDEHNRLVEKKIPGKGWEYIVYNILDQPILTRDANLDAQTRWLFTKYDIFGRVAYTGYITSGSTRQALQNAANAVTTTHVTKLGSATTLAGTTIYYSNNGYPTTNISEIYTINYYDNYTFDLAGGSSDTAYGVTPETNVKGLATGSKVRVLGTSDWITTVTYYDDRSRPIYVYSNNAYLNTTDKVKSDLSFDGTVLETYTLHTKGVLPTMTVMTVYDRYFYDHANRLTEHRHKVNSAALDEVIAANTYDDLGQLTEKGVGGKQNTTRLQDIDYDYNVRGWLRTINDPASLGSDLFGFKINYNTQDHGGTLLYNGNIAETAWKTANDNLLRRYRYEYDALNRLTAGIFNTGSGNQPNRYSVSNVDYDKNGNITALQRNGHENAAATSFGDMDNLVYTYETKSNRLKKVLDNGEDNFGFKDGADVATEYTYDDSGNMLTDLNKGISSNILYNHLNLPTQVTLSGGNIQYIYDATGIKQKKIVSTGTTTEYAGNFIYEDGTLMMFSHPEGYVEPPSSSAQKHPPYKYVYQYKDHLGNIRLIYSDSDKNGSIDSGTEIIEENNYYPFGLKHKGYNNTVSANSNSVASRFKYQSQELMESLGYNMYEFILRHYDAAIGRFVTTDPYEQFMSPYVAMGNNPVISFDPDGGHCYDANGNQIACPDADIYDDYRNSGDNHMTIGEEVNVGTVESNSSGPNFVQKSIAFGFVLASPVLNLFTAKGGAALVDDTGRASGDPDLINDNPGNREVQEMNVEGVMQAGGYAKTGKNRKSGDGKTNAKNVNSSKNFFNHLKEGHEDASDALDRAVEVPKKFIDPFIAEFGNKFTTDIVGQNTKVSYDRNGNIVTTKRKDTTIENTSSNRTRTWSVSQQRLGKKIDSLRKAQQ
ncbi:DUF6443 domain-containing protein [Winogradskyella sp.]|uniref:DUF6443 domain-containing protein n=1 Tax=Winogradskyella sp. TaxID=1883156 RepID=UPI003BAC8DA2